MKYVRVIKEHALQIIEILILELPAAVMIPSLSVFLHRKGRPPCPYEQLRKEHPMSNFANNLTRWLYLVVGKKFLIENRIIAKNIYFQKYFFKNDGSCCL